MYAIYSLNYRGGSGCSSFLLNIFFCKLKHFYKKKTDDFHQPNEVVKYSIFQLKRFYTYK